MKEAALSTRQPISFGLAFCVVNYSAGTSCLVKARRAQLPGVALSRLSLGLPGFCSVTALSPAWVFGWSGSSKLSPCSPIGWKWRRGWLQGLGRRSLRIAVDWKSCRHKGLRRGVASKCPLPVGEPPGSDRHCWCKRRWKEYAYLRKPWHFRRDPSLGPVPIRKHAPFERNGNRQPLRRANRFFV